MSHGDRRKANQIGADTGVRAGSKSERSNMSALDIDMFRVHEPVGITIRRHNVEHNQIAFLHAHAADLEVCRSSAKENARQFRVPQEFLETDSQQARAPMKDIPLLPVLK
jgi:hypothetical protein